VNSTEKFLLALNAGMRLTPAQERDPLNEQITEALRARGEDLTGAGARRFFPSKVEPRYPGEGNRLARRTAKAKRKGGAS
jgi:hypothetical protein